MGAIRADGLEVSMITTELAIAGDPTAVPILRTAHELSIPFLKPGYYHYKFVDVRREAAEAGQQFRGLSSWPRNTRSRSDFTITPGMSERNYGTSPL